LSVDVASTGVLVFSRDFCRGEYLSEVLDGSLSRPLADRLHLLEKLASVIDFLHVNGLVHAGITPYSIVVDRENCDCYLEYGIENPGVWAFRSPRVSCHAGYVGYVAPEQVARTSRTGAIDRFTFATISFELLTGVHPFGGFEALDLERLMAGRIPYYSDVEGQVSPRAYEVLRRAVAVDPTARFSSANDIVQALWDASGVARLTKRDTLSEDFHVEKPAEVSRAAGSHANADLPSHGVKAKPLAGRVRTLQLTDEESLELRKKLLALTADEQLAASAAGREQETPTNGTPSKRAQTKPNRPSLVVRRAAGAPHPFGKRDEAGAIVEEARTHEEASANGDLPIEPNATNGVVRVSPRQYPVPGGLDRSATPSKVWAPDSGVWPQVLVGVLVFVVVLLALLLWV
jgi:serine/threonine protein kinase